MSDDLDREIAEAVPQWDKYRASLGATEPCDCGKWRLCKHDDDERIGKVRQAVRTLVERRERAVLRDASFCDTCKLPKMCPGTVHRITGVAEAEARGAAQALRHGAGRAMERCGADLKIVCPHCQGIARELNARADAIEKGEREP